MFPPFCNHSSPLANAKPWQAGPDTLLELQEALFGVESCMEQCFLKPTDFVGAGVAAASLLG